MPTTLLRRLTTALATGLVLVLTAAPAHAATTYTVDASIDAPDASLADFRCLTAENECTLRAAIQQANATADLPDGPDQIVFRAGVGGRFTLNEQLPEITTDIDIRGPGASSLTLWGNADAQQRVFAIRPPAHVRIFGLTIAHGSAHVGGGIANVGAELSITDCVIVGNIAGAGGGIWSLGGRLTLVRSTIRDNNASFAAGELSGGGLYAWGSVAHIRETTFHRNGASRGGAIFSREGSFDVTGSTFSENAAFGDGGAIQNLDGSVSLGNSTLVANSAFGDGGAVDNFGTLRVRHSTIAGNSAASGAAVFTADFTVLRGTIVARNGAPSRPDMAGYSDGYVASEGGNLIANGTGLTLHRLSGPADQVGTAAAPIDPKLELDGSGQPRLRQGGGPTDTVALLPGSPAIDRGVDQSAPATDQRGPGFPRRRGAHVDVGAFESPNQAPVHTIPDGTQYTGEDTPLVFSAASGDAISVSDPDYAGSAPATTTLSVPAGSGTLASAGTPAGVMVRGAGTAEVTISGPPAAIAEAMDGFRFTPAADSNGPLTLTVKTTDNGDGNPASAAIDTDVVALFVREGNDPPVVADDTLPSMEDGGARLVPFRELLGNDAAGPANEAAQKLTVTAVGDSEGGTAELSSAGILFTPAPGYSGPARFTYTVDDDGSTNDERDPRRGTAGVRFGVTALNHDPVAPNDAATTVSADTAAPAAPRIDFPMEGGYDGDGSFSLRGMAEPGSIVTVRERGKRVAAGTTSPSGAWVATLSGVGDGRHAYAAAATDAAGNVSAASAERTIVVDTVAPAVRPLRPTRGVRAPANVVAVFSEAVDRRTLTGDTVSLTTRGGRSVTASVRYDARHRRVILDPRGRLAAGVLYVATIRGGRTGVKDLAGHALTKSVHWRFRVR